MGSQKNNQMSYEKDLEIVISVLRTTPKIIIGASAKMGERVDEERFSSILGSTFFALNVFLIRKYPNKKQEIRLSLDKISDELGRRRTQKKKPWQLN